MLVTSTYVSRVGRLGNSLFQIATVLAYGKDHGLKPVFTKWDYQDYIPLELIPEGTSWNRVADGGLNHWQNYGHLSKLGGNIDLHGHFLSQNFFKHRTDTVLETIRLLPQHEQFIKEKYGKHLEGNTCAIHVRRNDYLQPEQAAYHGVLPIDYYYRAIEFLYSSEKDVKFVICSDDIEWCKQHFKFTNVLYPQEKDVIDLFIMSKCRDNIIANSTFSWWSAWLNQDINTRCIAPKNWFITGGWDDLYKENWIRI